MPGNGRTPGANTGPDMPPPVLPPPDNARLARLIIEQVADGHDSGREAAITDLLEASLQTARSRLDLRDKLFEAARNTNLYTPRDIAEVLSETLSDQIRDLDQDLIALENTLLPSRFVMSTNIAAIFGAVVALLYGTADIILATGVTVTMGLVFFTTQMFRKRVGRRAATIFKRRANYDAFRTLLRQIL